MLMMTPLASLVYDCHVCNVAHATGYRCATMRKYRLRGNVISISTTGTTNPAMPTAIARGTR